MVDLKSRSPSVFINFLKLRVVLENNFHMTDINVTIN